MHSRKPMIVGYLQTQTRAPRVIQFVPWESTLGDCDRPAVALTVAT
jgi:hypothetical protein